jgi:membrane-bound lytic murein transglycosylase D
VKAGDTLVVSKPELTPQVEKENAKNQPSKNRPKLAKGEKYAVREGDTYAAIAKNFDVPVVMLMQANQGFNKRLMVGDSLVIPEYVRKKGDKKQAKSESSKSASKKPSNEKVSVYIVQSGDNLSSISRKFGTSVAKLQELNNMGSSTNLSVGQKLKVAGASEVEYKIHSVRKGEGLWDIARQYKVTIEDIVKWNDLQDTKIKMGQKLKIKR